MKSTSPRVIALLVTTLLMLNMFAILAIRPAIGVEELPDYEPVDWQTSLAGSPEMPTIEETPAEGVAASVATVESFATTPPVGTKVYDWYLEAISVGTPTGTQPWMTLRAVSATLKFGFRTICGTHLETRGTTMMWWVEYNTACLLLMRCANMWLTSLTTLFTPLTPLTSERPRTEMEQTPSSNS